MSCKINLIFKKMKTLRINAFKNVLWYISKNLLIPHYLRFQDNIYIKTKMKNKSAIQISNNKKKG